MSIPNLLTHDQSRDISTTFAKGLSVLSAFDEAHTDLTMPQVVEATGLDRASVRRLVLTLVHLGYLEKVGRSFRLTPRVLRHAGAYLRGNQIGSVVQPILNRHAGELGSPISLATLDGSTAMYVAQSTLPDSAISFGFTVGSRLPALHTAVGRMLLACAATDRAGRIVRDTSIVRHTPRTRMDRQEILRAVAAAQRDGVAIVRGEFEAAATGIAVPVGPSDAARVVVGASGQGARLDDAAERARFVTALQGCASAIARTGVL